MTRGCTNVRRNSVLEKRPRELLASLFYTLLKRKELLGGCDDGELWEETLSFPGNSILWERTGDPERCTWARSTAQPMESMWFKINRAQKQVSRLNNEACEEEKWKTWGGGCLLQCWSLDSVPCTSLASVHTQCLAQARLIFRLGALHKTG